MSAILRTAVAAVFVGSLATLLESPPTTAQAASSPETYSAYAPVLDPTLPYPDPVRSALSRMIELDKRAGIGEPEREVAVEGSVVPASLVESACNSPCADALNCGDSCSCGDACSVCEPTWIVSTGAVILNRTRPDPGRNVNSLISQNIISSGSDFNFDWAAGPELALARRMDSGNLLEVRYFGALNWNASVNYGNPGNFQLGPFANFAPLNLSADYQTSLNSAEINWKHPVTERFTWLAGLRWLELQDVLHYGVTFGPASGDFYANENNHLYGGQLGAEFNLWRGTSPWSLRSVGKAGLYGNSADNAFTLIATPGGRIDAGASRGQAAFVGEIGVIGGYQISQHVALRGGYQLLWIDGVAIASDQIAAATAALSANSIDARGDVFFHGATCGLEFAW